MANDTGMWHKRKKIVAFAVLCLIMLSTIGVGIYGITANRNSLQSEGVSNAEAAGSGIPRDVILRHPLFTDCQADFENFTLLSSTDTIVSYENACPSCMVWGFPIEANLPEEYMRRYYFPDFGNGFSIAFPNSWQGIYNVVGLGAMAPNFIGAFGAYIVEEMENPTIEAWSSLSLFFVQFPLIREQLHISAGSCLGGSDNPLSSVQRVLLAQDEQYIYFVHIPREFLLEDLSDLQNITPESFADAMEKYPFVLNSFRLIEPYTNSG